MEFFCASYSGSSYNTGSSSIGSSVDLQAHSILKHKKNRTVTKKFLNSIGDTHTVTFEK